MAESSGSDTAAHLLSKRFSRMEWGTLPPASIHSVKRLLLDYLGVALAGSVTQSGRIAAKFAAADGGHTDASLIGSTFSRVPAGQAAFANAISSHSVELDDIDVFAYFHFSPPVFSAALAIAEKVGANGQQLLLALIAGCEMMERVSRAANPSLRDRCYHSTPTCGVFGAAVSTSLLLKLTPVQMVSALGLAAAQACGTLEFHGPSMQKRFSPGPSARGGITSAQMALLGFTGQDTAIEGPRGFLKAFTDHSDVSQLLAGLNEPYHLDIEFKPYSCARPIHNAIDAALRLRQKENPDVLHIRSIEIVRHPSWAHKHQNNAPKSYHAAQMSIEYSVAIALHEGQALLAQYTSEKLQSPSVVRLMQNTRVSTDPDLPRGVSCRVKISMDDGRLLSDQVDYPKGSIQFPMSDAEIEAKFRSLAEPVIGMACSNALVDRVAHLEQEEQVCDLMSLIRLTP